MDRYQPNIIEPKWQKKWEEWGLYQAKDLEKKPKKYLLIEFPYPSGERLHVGHGRSYCCLDAMARLSRMKGFNVLYPIGWDAFGLPAENYAIKTGINPSITTKENIDRAKAQAKSWGLSFDWSREINTTDHDYYRFTQWIFIQLFKKGLAYQAEVPVNWCPQCKTTLADEEVLSDGTHERCGEKTERRMQKQWIIKITAYAERLLKDLDLVDYRSDIRQQQINWIGKTEGIIIDYPIVGSDKFISCYSTRPDTNFGATFVVIAPEHQMVCDLTTKENLKSVNKYIEIAKKKSELERIREVKEKTGVFTGSYCLNRLTGKKMPIFVSDFVILSAGTGVVVGVPAHDNRDWQFAKKYGLEIVPVVKSNNPRSTPGVNPRGEWDYSRSAFTDINYAEIFNSDFLNGLIALEAKEKIIDYLVKKGWGRKAVNYHLRDWVFSRQHYWGEPIPMIFCARCAKNQVQSAKFKVQSDNSKFKIDEETKKKMFGWFPVPEKDLPVVLPYVEKYQPSGTGESPLAKVTEWVKVACPECGSAARRETDTMPNWAGSNWYFLAYVLAHKLGVQRLNLSCHAELVSVSSSDPKGIPKQACTEPAECVRDDKCPISPKNIFEENKELLKYWLPVDLYNGGMEHTTLHLLYSRFIYKFLFDLGLVPTPEPYARRWSHGVVLGPDNQKMSKSKGNVINPDEIVKKYGADTFRLYEAFMGPFDQMIAWDEKGIKGCYRFLNRVWELVTSVISAKAGIDKNKTVILNEKSVILSEAKDLTNYQNDDRKLWKQIYKTTKKVEEDIWHLKFNTAIAALMELLNDLYAQKDNLTLEMLRHFLLILSPFAPFIFEELWQKLNQFDTETKDYVLVHQMSWPKFDEKLLVNEEVTIAVQVNGKLRDTVCIMNHVSCIKERVEETAKNREKIAKYLKGKKIKKVVFVPGRLINFVV